MHGALCTATALAALAAPTFGAGRPTYSVDYVVRLSRREPGLAHVHWLLAGIDEIAAFRLVFRDDRTTDVRGPGLDRDPRAPPLSRDQRQVSNWRGSSTRPAAVPPPARLAQRHRPRRPPRRHLPGRG